MISSSESKALVEYGHTASSLTSYGESKAIVEFDRTASSLPSYGESKKFVDYSQAATYLKKVFEGTKAEGTSNFKIKCVFPGPDRSFKKVKCFFDHDYEKKIPPESLENLKRISKMLNRGIGICTDNKETDVYEIKLVSSTFDKREMDDFTEALSSQGLLVGISVIVNSPKPKIKEIKEPEEERLLKHVEKDKDIKLGGKNWTCIPSEILEKLNANKFKNALDLSDNSFSNLKGIKISSFIKRIDLSNNKLTKVPKKIKKATFLQHIDLRGNPINSIPSWLKKMNFKRVEILWDRPAKSGLLEIEDAPRKPSRAKPAGVTLKFDRVVGSFNGLEMVTRDPATITWIEKNK